MKFNEMAPGGVAVPSETIVDATIVKCERAVGKVEPFYQRLSLDYEFTYEKGNRKLNFDNIIILTKEGKIDYDIKAISFGHAKLKALLIATNLWESLKDDDIDWTIICKLLKGKKVRIKLLINNKGYNAVDGKEFYPILNDIRSNTIINTVTEQDVKLDLGDPEENF